MLIKKIDLLLLYSTEIVSKVISFYVSKQKKSGKEKWGICNQTRLLNRVSNWVI